MEAKALAAESQIARSGTKEDALQHAISAIELYMKATKSAGKAQDKVRLQAKCIELVTRAEEIKTAYQWPLPPVSQRVITRTEEIILLEGSKLHGFIFPRWTSDPQDSAFEEAINGSPIYTEPSDLKLADAQIEIFGGWRRPPNSGREFLMTADDVDLVQDITTDCSVVASLCAGMARAAKGHGKLLDSMIYPYDRKEAHPRMSKNGKYMFRFNFNGCFRKVVIDDRLPTSNGTRNLHVIDRNNPELLWPALIEKAYLKIRGGYDFPGSNSGTDLWVLTGWIPEQVFLQSDDFQSQHLWSRIFNSFKYGDNLITLGTGRLTRREEKELGLAGEHDYAVLDMKEVDSQRLMLIKNPWCDGMIWKGSHFSPPTSATDSWSSDLREALPGSKSALLPGTFWMSFEDVAQNYESLYLNWNPALFIHRQDHHFSWAIPKITSAGSFTHNPQYILKTNTKGTVWVLLSRHFQTSEHDILKENQRSSSLGFISLYIFAADGHRVYLSDDALHRGAYVDSPQTLARLDASPSTSYTVVVAQHGLPLPKYSFTLSFFSRSPLHVASATDSLTHCTSHTGSWTLRTAGGNASAETYPTNPQFAITLPLRTSLLLVLETDEPELAVHVKLVWGGGKRVTAVTSKDILAGSGDYRRGCALASVKDVEPGKYTIVCSTFEAGQLGNFTLRVGSMISCPVLPIPSETAGRLTHRLPVLIFQEGVDRMLAPITVSRLTRLRVVVRCLRANIRSQSQSQSPRSRPLLKLSLERGQGPNKVPLEVSAGGDFSDAPMGVRTNDMDLHPVVKGGREAGVWIVVERLGGRSGVDEVEVEVLSDSAVVVGLWGTGDG